MKKILKIVWNEFIHGGHLLALGGVSVASTAFYMAEAKINIWYLAVVYIGIYLVYRFDRNEGKKIAPIFYFTV